MKRIAWCLLLIGASTLPLTMPGYGCAGDEATPDDVVVTPDAASPTDADVEEPLPPGAICRPGEAKACIVEGGKQAVLCNSSGTGWIEGICKGFDGLDSSCRNDQCTPCFPGVKSCDGDGLVVVCRDDGSGYDPYQECEGGTSGQVCRDGACQKLCDLNYKFNSYIGCDYWGVDLDNAFVPAGNESGYYDALNAQYAIVVANPPDSPVPALVEIFEFEDGKEQLVAADTLGQPLDMTPLAPGELRVYRLGPRNVNGTVQAPLAYKINSSAPVIAYQFNPLENENVFSNDASLLLPATLLERDYIVMTREQTFDILRGYLTVVAVMPGETEVSVQVTASTMAGHIYPDTDNSSKIEHMEPGTTKNFTLQQYDVLNIETDRPGADLTGSLVRANRRIAVFGGSEAANAPNTARCIDVDDTGFGVCAYDQSKSCRDLMDCVNAGYNTCCADHLEQQLFPVSTWGTQYVATKSWDRNREADLWRIMAAQNNTNIVLVPPQAGVSVPTLNRGDWFEFESRDHFEIRSDEGKPILVGQFLAAQDAPDPNVGGRSTAGDARTGDPAFMLAVPVEQYRRDYVVLAPDEYAFNYISLVTVTGATARIDGIDVDPQLFEPIGSGTFSVYRQQVNPGTHSITSTEPASVIVYGYDQYVSYGYTGGLNLTELNSGIGLPPVGSD